MIFSESLSGLINRKMHIGTVAGQNKFEFLEYVSPDTSHKKYIYMINVMADVFQIFKVILSGDWTYNNIYIIARTFQRLKIESLY